HELITHRALASRLGVPGPDRAAAALAGLAGSAVGGAASARAAAPARAAAAAAARPPPRPPLYGGLEHPADPAVLRARHRRRRRRRPRRLAGRRGNRPGAELLRTGDRLRAAEQTRRPAAGGTEAAVLTAGTPAC